MSQFQANKKISANLGFTLLEVLVSLGIFSLLSISALNATQGYLRHLTNISIKTEAAAIAMQKIDELRTQNPEDFPDTGTDDPETITSARGRSFQVYLTYCSNSNWCESPRSRHIEIEVQLNGESIFEAETVHTRLR